MTDEFIPLLDFVPEVSPRFRSPRHLGRIADVFQRIARGEQVQVVVSVPPRFGKSELLLHGAAWLLAQDPTLQIIYASYGQRVAEKKSRRARELARKAGVPLAQDSKARADWRTTEDDGGMFATSIDGAVTGEGAHVLICDDLTKGRAEAESATMRERARGWLLSDALTRLEPSGSVIVNMTRWHPEDPAGVAIGLGFEVINLTAITPEVESLWPERWPLKRLLEIRETLGGENGYEWQSLYMGNPRGRGSRVFGDVTFRDELPVKFDAIAIGLDFAYSTRTSADFSVAVVLGRAEGLYHVLDVVRVHEEPRDFRERVRNLIALYPGAYAAAYSAHTELGGIEFIRDGGIHVEGHVAKLDKFSRAIPVAAAWNTGKIRLPRSAPWLDAFVSELCGFTGVKDRHDDQVDALAAAFDAVALGRAMPIDADDEAELAGSRFSADAASDWRRSGYGGDGNFGGGIDF